ncbi:MULTISPECIES: hypothetical protein [Oscillatoriales]|nr:hypothetical protein AP9108_35195 [Arthrospira sp. PCC 9108]
MPALRLDSFFQALPDADVVHHQASGFIAKDPVNQGDRQGLA